MPTANVMSVYTLVNQGSHPLGNAFAGTVMEYFGAAMGFVGCGVMAVVLLVRVPGTTRILSTSSKNYSNLG